MNKMVNKRFALFVLVASMYLNSGLIHADFHFRSLIIDGPHIVRHWYIRHFNPKPIHNEWDLTNLSTIVKQLVGELPTCSNPLWELEKADELPNNYRRRMKKNHAVLYELFYGKDGVIVQCKQNKDIKVLQEKIEQELEFIRANNTIEPSCSPVIK